MLILFLVAVIPDRQAPGLSMPGASCASGRSQSTWVRGPGISSWHGQGEFSSLMPYRFDKRIAWLLRMIWLQRLAFPCRHKRMDPPGRAPALYLSRVFISCIDLVAARARAA
jgi:hypothetical protein